MAFCIRFISAIDNIVDGRDAVGFAPDILGQHFAGDDLARLAEQVGQEIELAGRQIDWLAGARDPPLLEVHDQIGNVLS
jgi:hypothetical protein